MEVEEQKGQGSRDEKVSPILHMELWLEDKERDVKVMNERDGRKGKERGERQTTEIISTGTVDRREMNGGAAKEEHDQGRKQKRSEDDAGALTRFSAGGVGCAGMGDADEVVMERCRLYKIG